MSDVIKFPQKGSPARPASTTRSTKYRLRASQLGRQADAEPSEQKMLAFLHQALSWIQLAENEELLFQNDKCPIVLVVEDKATHRLEAVSMIEHAGYEALEAGSADDALSILESRPGVDVVFTDVRMAGDMDGLKLAAAVRARWPSIAVVTTSGAVEIGDDQLPAGCLFLPKPYSAEQMIGTIQRTVSAG
jgi:two-component system, response regulator PdtaR